VFDYKGTLRSGEHKLYMWSVTDEDILTEELLNPIGKISTVHTCDYQTYTVSQKNIPDIFNCNLKTDYQILIIFGTNISDTTSHQMIIQFSTSPNVCFCTSWGNHKQQNISFLSNAI